LGYLKDMVSNRGGVGARGDRQDIRQKLSRCGVRNERGPSRFQIKPLGGDMPGDEFDERGDGRLAFGIACAAPEPRTRQPDIAIQGMEDDWIASVATPAMATRIAAPSRFGPTLDLLFNETLLDGGEKTLTFREGEAKVLGSRGGLVQGRDFFDFARRAVVGGDLKQNSHPHGFSPSRVSRRRRSRPQNGLAARLVFAS
jgi:hypothetical protein